MLITNNKLSRVALFVIFIIMEHQCQQLNDPQTLDGSIFYRRNMFLNIGYTASADSIFAPDWHIDTAKFTCTSKGLAVGVIINNHFYSKNKNIAKMHQFLFSYSNITNQLDGNGLFLPSKFEDILSFEYQSGIDIAKRFLTKHTKCAIVSLSSKILTTTQYKNEKAEDPELASIKDTSSIYKQYWYNSSNYKATLHNKTSLEIGFNKVSNKLPYAKILKIERFLMQKKVARFSFSDKTIAHLISLVGCYDNKTLNNPEITASFKRELDSILADEPAIERKKLRYVSILDIKRMVLKPVEPLLTGTNCRFYSTTIMSGKIEKLTKEYLCEDQKLYNINDIEATPLINEIVGLRFYTANLTDDRIYLSCKADRQIFNSANRFYYDNIDIKKLLDIRWNFSATIWPSDWFLWDLTIKNTPCWIIIPHALPYSFSSAFRFLIEDDLVFSIEATFNQEKKAIYVPYQNFITNQKHKEDGLRVNLTVLYDF